MLSICIPTYNRAKLLERNLKHLLAFTKLDIEVCISNNNSNDDTLNVIEKYKSKFKSFNFITVPKTLDMLSNYSSAMKLASQEYTMLLSDDDLVNEDDLVMGLNDLQKNQDWIAIYSGFKKFDLAGNLLETLKFSETLEVFDLTDAHKLPGRFIALDMGIHRSKLNKYLIETHSNYCALGWETLSILLLYGKVCVAPYFFMNRTHHEGQCSNINNNDPKLNDGYFSSMEIFLSRLNCSSNEKLQALVNFKASYFRYRMWRSLQRNDLIYANIAINRGMLYNPKAFEIFAKEWDQKYLLPGTIQCINEKVSSKPYLKRVFIYSNDAKKLEFLSTLVSGKISIEPIKASRDSQISNFDNLNDFIIFFDDADSEEFGQAYNSEVFLNLINRLKFTSQEITFSH
tara:strand:- start:6965 stop:8164 length:1200 start_codon:yes stop_codon:yes gene_type:complete